MKNRENTNLIISIISFDDGKITKTKLANYIIEKKGNDDFNALSIRTNLICKYNNLYNLIKCTMGNFFGLMETTKDLIHAYYCTDEEIIHATMDCERHVEFRRKENKDEENRYLKILYYPYNKMYPDLLDRMRIDEIYKPGSDQELLAYLLVDLDPFGETQYGKEYISSNIEESINRFFDGIILNTDYKYGKLLAITSDEKVYSHKIAIDNNDIIEVKFVYYPDINRRECEEITDVTLKKHPATKQETGCVTNNFCDLIHKTIEDAVSSLLVSIWHRGNYSQGKISALFIDGTKMDLFIRKNMTRAYDTEKLMYDFKIINPDAGCEDASERLFGYYSIITNNIAIPYSTRKYLKEEIFEYSIYNLESHIQYRFHKSLKDAIKAETDRIKQSNDVSGNLVVVFKDNREIHEV